MKGPLGNIMKQAQRMQEELQKAQQRLAEEEVTGESGGGLVKVTLNGRHEARRVSIDPSLLNDDKDLSEAEKTKLVVSSGKDKIAGRTYDYDKIKVSEGEEQIYYFDEGTNKWRYWKTSEALMEIIEYGSKVDENLFKIPKGYTKMEI